jgi:hypothetical protein
MKALMSSGMGGGTLGCGSRDFNALIASDRR